MGSAVFRDRSEALCRRIEFRFVQFAGLVSLLFCPAGQAEAQTGSPYLRLEHRIEDRELALVLGPVDLPARTGHHGIRQLPLMTATVPSKIWIQGFTVQMVDSSGGAITNRLLHHVNVVDPDHRELFTPTARRLFAAGQETRSESIPGFLGVPVEVGQRLLVTTMFHNPTDRSYPGSRLQVILRYREKGWLGPVSVYPVYLDAMGPVGRKDFDLPPGRSERSWQGSPAIRGRLLGIGGHLHRYAEVLRFEDLTDPRVIWEGRPRVDSSGRVLQVPAGHLWKRGGAPLEPDHTYRLTAVYHNPTSDTIRAGGMGAMGGVFLPQRDERWPRVDRTHPQYVADLLLLRNRPGHSAFLDAGLLRSRPVHRH